MNQKHDGDLVLIPLLCYLQCKIENRTVENVFVDTLDLAKLLLESFKSKNK